VLDDLSTGKTSNLQIDNPSLNFFEGDIADRETVDRVMPGVEAIYHLAAVASVQASVDDPVTTHRANFDGTLNLLEAARHNGVQRFFYASSAAVYGDLQTLPIVEENILKPLTPYAADKLAGEHFIDFYVRQVGLQAMAFRFFNIFGPRQDPNSPYSGVISIFADRVTKQLPITVFGDGRQTRDFVYVGDLVKILAAGLDVADPGFEVVNVGTGRETSLLQLLDALMQTTGHPVTPEFAEARSGDIRHSLADNSRLKALFGFGPETSLVDGLAALIDSL